MNTVKQILKYSLILTFIIAIVWVVGAVWESSSSSPFTGPPIGEVLKWIVAIAACLGSILVLYRMYTFVSSYINDKLIAIKESSKRQNVAYAAHSFGIDLSILVLTIASSITTAMGLWMLIVQSDAGFLSVSIFLILVLLLPIGIYLGWHVLMRVAMMKSISLTKKFVVAFFSLVLCSIVFFASTATSVTGIGGKTVFQSHLVQSLYILNKDLKKVADFRQSEKNLMLLAARQKEHWSNIAKEESINGTYTSSSGKGPLYKYLMSLSATFGQIEQSIIHGGISTLDTDVALVSSEIEDLINEIGEKNTSEIYDNQKHYINKIKMLTARVNGLSNQNQLKSIEPTIKYFDSFTPKTDTSSESNELAKQQNKMMDTFGETITKSIQSMTGLLSETQALKPNKSSYEHMNMFEGVFVYAFDIKPFWAIAILMDFIPLFILWLLLVAGRELMLTESNPSI